VIDQSPFGYTRYEYEGRHLYYVPPDLRRQLERSLPVYVIGSRGTGKTTLLRYLNWQERLVNTDLAAELGGRPFASGIIGVYLRLPTVQLAMFERWLADLGEEAYGAIFSSYLELNCMELMLDAVLGLADAGTIAPHLAAEAEVSARLVESFTAEGPSASLAQCKERVRTVRRRFDRMARERTAPRDAYAAGVSIQAVGSIIRTAAPLLIRLCDEFGKEDVRDGWTFRLCLDEAEALSPTQQLTLNTIVRLSEWPAFPIAAYVARPSDDRTTLVPSLALQRADLVYVVRDEVSDRDFEALADGVGRLRLRRALVERGADPEAAQSYSVRKQLGSLRLNHLLERILRRSESDFADSLLEQASRSKGQAEAPDGEDLPIYQTYLIDRLALAQPESGRRRRRFSSEELRKKMVAAYLSICNEVNARPEYAFAEMLLQTCDKCIRDFLWQMDAVYERANYSTEDFAAGRAVGIEAQVVALRDASERKLARLPRLIEVAPSLAQSLVEGLGELTAVVQRSDPHDRHLASTERGLFTVELDPSEQVGRALVEIIQDAAEWGFLKLLESGPPRWGFRVHTSLAPLCGFSYRGSYYPYQLLQSEVESLARASDLRDRRDQVAKIVSRVSGRSSRVDDAADQPTLGFDE
jgi:hypothetical protein